MLETLATYLFPVVLFVFTVINSKTIAFFGKKRVIDSFSLYTSIIVTFILHSLISILLLYFELWSLHTISVVSILFLSLSLWKYFRLKAFVIKYEVLTFPAEKWKTIVTLLLIMYLFFVYSAPSLGINTRYDTGAYVAAGINIANTGSITIKHSSYQRLSSRLKKDLKLTPASNFYPDFVISDTETLFSIQPPLNQLWLATLYKVNGLTGLFFLMPLISSISLITIYYLGKTLFNNTTGLLSMILLGTSHAQAFFSQYVSPELLFQFVFFSGLLFFLKQKKDASKLFSIVSGLLFGLLLFVRIESYIVAFLLLTVFLWKTINKTLTRHDLFFYISYVGVFIIHILYFFKFLTHYVSRIFSAVAGVVGTEFFIFIAFAFLIFVLIALVFKRKLIDHLSSNLPKIFFFLTLIMFLYMYLPVFDNFRPTRGSIDALEVLATFNTPIGVLFGWLGIFMAIRSNKLVRPFLFISSILVLIPIYVILNNPAFPWALRRHITVLMPFLTIFVAFFLSQTSKLFSNKAHAISVLTVALMILTSINFNLPLFTQQYSSYPKILNKLEKSIPKNSIVIDISRYSNTNFSSALMVSELQYETFSLNPSLPISVINNLLTELEDGGNQIYLLSRVPIDALYEEQNISQRVNFITSIPVEDRRLQWVWISRSINLNTDWGNIKYKSRLESIKETILIYKVRSI